MIFHSKNNPSIFIVSLFLMHPCNLFIYLFSVLDFLLWGEIRILNLSLLNKQLSTNFSKCTTYIIVLYTFVNLYIIRTLSVISSDPQRWQCPIYNGTLLAHLGVPFKALYELNINVYTLENQLFSIVVFLLKLFLENTGELSGFNTLKPRKTRISYLIR